MHLHLQTSSFTEPHPFISLHSQLFSPVTFDLLIFISTLISIYRLCYNVDFKQLIFYRERTKLLCGKTAQKDLRGKCVCAGTENGLLSKPVVILHTDQRPNIISCVFGFVHFFLQLLIRNEIPSSCETLHHTVVIQPVRPVIDATETHPLGF